MKRHYLHNWDDAKVLFSDDRLRIIGFVREEPLSISRLAEQLDLNPGSVHNHIQKLLKAGVVKTVESDGPNKRGAPEKRYVLVADEVLIGDLSPEDKEKAQRAIGKRAARDTVSILGSPNGRARRYDGYLTTAQHEEVIAVLDELSERFASAPDDDKKLIRFIYTLGETS